MHVDISGPLVYTESEESLVDESEWESEEEQEEHGQDIQDLSMVVYVYNELMKNTMNVDFSTIKFKYQCGVQVSRQTVWRHKKAQQDLRNSATGCRPLTAYFTPTPLNSEAAPSLTANDPLLKQKRF
ncbi:hypothetical protein BDZ91DRAFT_717912 [Kalaharituber pfeilii]|nr:hypothetical protein BDZ91DRAFT_717912 [Kalaharituber pfeilii]